MDYGLQTVGLFLVFVSSSNQAIDISAESSMDDKWQGTKIRSNDRNIKITEVIYIDYGNTENKTESMHYVGDWRISLSYEPRS